MRASVRAKLAATALAVAIIIGLASGPTSLHAQQLPAQEQPGPGNQRAVIARLAELAGVPPRDLLAAVQEHGGLHQALNALGVDDQQLLAALTEVVMQRYAPAVAEGRLTTAQARQVSRRGAQRLLRGLNRLVQPMRRP